MRTIELCEQLKPLGLTWELHVAGHYRLRHVEGHEGSAGCRLLIVGFESGDPQILKNIKKGATVERARAFAKDCHDLGLTIHGDFILGLPGETKESIRNTINFAKVLDVETIQVSIAHAYPGTEFYDYAKANGFITNEKMEDGGGHQMAHIEYPGLPTDYVMEMVHRFLRRILLPVSKAAAVPSGLEGYCESRSASRLYVEAKSFLKAARSSVTRWLRTRAASRQRRPPTTSPGPARR